MELIESDVEYEQQCEREEEMILADTSNLVSSMECYSNLLNTIKDKKLSCVKMKYDLIKRLYYLDTHRMKLLDELQFIYPIILLENGNYSIRNVELSTDCYGASR